MMEVNERGGGIPSWTKLRSNREYVANWRENAGEPSVIEPSRFPLRLQTFGDLEAARWGLLTLENPRQAGISPFWANVTVLEA